MLRYGVGLADAGQHGIGNKVPIGIDLDAHLAEPVLRELRLSGDERVLLLGTGAVLEDALLRVVSANRCHLTDSPPGSTLGSFDLSLLDLSSELPLEPSEVTYAAAESLRPGGRLALIVQNPHSLRLWPEVDGFQSIWNSYLSCRGRSPIESADLEIWIQDAELRPLGHTTFRCSAGHSHGNLTSLASQLIAALCGAREEIMAMSGLRSEAFAACITALQGWRENQCSSLWHNAAFALGRRRMREYLTLLPGAELAYSGG